MSVKKNKVWGLQMLFHGQDITASTCLLPLNAFCASLSSFTSGR
jgi:hypothetical protein